MEIVATAPAYQVYLIGAETELRRIGLALHLEFLNRVLRQNDRGRI